MIKIVTFYLFSISNACALLLNDNGAISATRVSNITYVYHISNIINAIKYDDI